MSDFTMLNYLGGLSGKVKKEFGRDGIYVKRFVRSVLRKKHS